jgi:hypothetical protein
MADELRLGRACAAAKLGVTPAKSRPLINPVPRLQSRATIGSWLCNFILHYTSCGSYCSTAAPISVPIQVNII